MVVLTLLTPTEVLEFFMAKWTLVAAQEARVEILPMGGLLGQPLELEVVG